MAISLTPAPGTSAISAGAPTSGRFMGVTTSGAPASGTYAVGDFVVTQNGQMFVCTIAGTPGTWVNPADTRNLLTTGEEIVNRDVCGSAATGPSGTQQLRLMYFTARKTEVTTQARMVTGGTAAGATPTLCRWGLYEIASNGDGTLVGSIANDTTLFAGTNTVYTKSWSASFTKTAGKRYAFGLLVVSGAAMPTFFGALVGNTAEYAVAPQLTGLIGSQSDLPSSFVAGSVTASSARMYAAILP